MSKLFQKRYSKGMLLRSLQMVSLRQGIRVIPPYLISLCRQMLLGEDSSRLSTMRNLKVKTNALKRTWIPIGN